MTIRQLRKKLLLTQDEFAEKIGVTKQCISKWESNKTKPQNAYRKRLNIIARQQGCELDYGD